MTSTQAARPPRNRTRVAVAITAAAVAALVILFFIFANLYADVLWYDQLNFLGVLLTQWGAGIAMFAVGFVAMAVPVWASIELAFRFRPVYAKLNSQLDRYQQVVEPLRRLAMWGVPAVLGLFGGASAAAQWQTVLEFLNSTPFNKTDPQFGLDISFYVFQAPFLHLALGFASAVVILAFIGALATSYLYGGIRVNGREVRISRVTRVQLAVTAAVYLVLQALSIWLDQYTTLYAGSGGFIQTGPGYAVANATIPARAIISLAAAIVAVLFVITAFIGRWRFPLIGTALLIVASLVVGGIYPWIVQRFQVAPSAQTLESPFIQRNIDATRDAYNVANVDQVGYDATTTAESGALRQDAATTANIRIIDPNIVSPTFRQLEQVRQYYQFDRTLDVDRYSINGTTQDTVVAVRELNQTDQSTASWYNNTIVYTHGYGVVAASGSERSSDGSPVFLEGGIPSSGELTDALGQYQPRIYFGLASPQYSIVGAPKGTTPAELDYPTGGGGDDQSASTRTTFDGNGGPKLDNVFKRLVYSLKFQSEQILLSDGVNDDSQILYDRNPIERVQKAAPYLKLDSNAYPAIVDGRVVWIVDGYTTTDSYPYSTNVQMSNAISDTYTDDPQFASGEINYIRNSVKATVDAYDGKVTLYAWDTSDPVLKTYEKIFPNTLKPRSDMSEQLMAHVRYPEDLFKVQRNILGDYHVTDPGTFFQGNNEWITPDDPAQNAASTSTTARTTTTTTTGNGLGTSSDAGAKLQPPYYLTMQVPGTSKPGFTLYSTFIPSASGTAQRSVLTGYLTASSDVGNDYGKLTLLTIPADESTVPGPGSVEARFQSDASVGQQLNTLRIGQTQVISGNLLTVPVGGGLLYVQPVYVQSNGGTSYPLLRKVLVAFGDQIAFEDTLDEGLNALFGGNSGAVAGDEGASSGSGGGTGTGGTGSGSGTGTDTGGSGTGSGSGSGSGSGTGSGTDGTTTNAALQQALQQAQQALQDRQAAYASNDLVAAAEADQRLQQAISAALQAEGAAG